METHKRKRTAKGLRKTKVFSISLREPELEHVDRFLEKERAKTGFGMSRNEFMRRCALAHLKIQETNNEEYNSIFRSLASEGAK